MARPHRLCNRAISQEVGDLASVWNVQLFELDFVDPKSIDAVVAEVKDRTGGSLDILINNAGQQYILPALKVDVDAARNLFEVNYCGERSAAS